MPRLAEIYEPWLDTPRGTAETGGWASALLGVGETCRLLFPMDLVSVLQAFRHFSMHQLHVVRLFLGVSCLAYFLLVKRILQPRSS